jgi:beta-glucosidase
MAAQNMVNGRPMHANYRLLTEVLRQEWGVEHALVISDGPDCIGALHDGFHVAATKEEVAVLSLESGMDMDLGGVSFPLLIHAVATNKTTEKAVDRAVYNVLVSKFAAGLFEHPYTDETRVQHLDGVANRAMAREAAEQSMVLLINRPAPQIPAPATTTTAPLRAATDNDDVGAAAAAVDADDADDEYAEALNGAGGIPTLPLDLTKIKQLALVGPLADSVYDQVRRRIFIGSFDWSL